jgi:hypothetical protein
MGVLVGIGIGTDKDGGCGGVWGGKEQVVEVEEFVQEDGRRARKKLLSDDLEVQDKGFQ